MALPSLAELHAAFRGLGLVVRGDRRALAFYDLSVEGFWRSFWPPLLIAIPYLLLLDAMAVALSTGAEEPVGISLLPQAVLQLSSWLGYLLVMVLYCRAFALTAGYAAFVVLYNWGQAIFMAATVLVLAASHWGLLPPGAPVGWSGMLLVLWIYVVVQMARLALGARTGVAIVAALLDVAMTVLLHRLVDLIL